MPDDRLVELQRQLMLSRTADSIDLLGASSVDVTSRFSYPDGEPVRIQVTLTGDGGTMSDGGRTVSYLRRTIRTMWDISRFRWLISKYGTALTLVGDELETRFGLGTAEAVGVFGGLATACSELSRLEAAAHEDSERRRAEEDAKRDAGIGAFKLSSRDDAVAFDARLRDYSARYMSPSFDAVSLVDAFDFLSKHRPDDGNRVFVALFDVAIGYVALVADLTSVRREWSGYVVSGGRVGGEAMDTLEAFSTRMEIHRSVSSFVLRYRALWDKIMGVLVLLLAPAKYKAFDSAKSKRRMFKRIAEETTALTSLGSEISTLVESFDVEFRTAEAHGPGQVRKWTFLMETPGATPYLELEVFWLSMSSILRHVGDVFRPAETILLSHIGQVTELFDRYPAPKPMQATIEGMVAVLSDAARTSADTHYRAILSASIRLHILAVEAMVRWRYHNADRTRIDKDVEALRVACAEMPSLWDQLLEGARALAEYPIEHRDGPRRAGTC